MTHHSRARLVLPVASVTLLVWVTFAQQQPAQAPAGRGNFANNFTGNISVLDEIGRAPSELQSLMRISYAVFCLKKKK